LKDFDFKPDLTISVGETVSWVNRDDILHTVTSGKGQKQGVPGVSENKDAEPDGLFDQEMDGVGAEFSFTFEEAGTYSYFCAIHPGMRGKVTVE
jgi:plastocyanin